MKTKKITKALIYGAENELLTELLPTPLAVIKRLNKLSKIKGSRAEELFLICGIDPGKLTFDFFTPYTYNYVNFGPLSLAQSGKMSGVVSILNTPINGMLPCRLSASASLGLVNQSDVLMTVKDGAVCRGEYLSYRCPDGRLLPCLGISDDLYLDESAEVVKIGIDPLPCSALVWLDAMRVIGNKTIEANNKRAKELKKQAKVVAVAKKECAKRLSGFGSIDVPECIRVQVYNNCLAWARKKVG